MSDEKHERAVVDASGHYKLEQLTSQVEQALATALAGSADGILRNLTCVRVSPVRGGGSFEVTIRPSEEAPAPDVVLATLRRASGYLRSEIASEIHRKRTPELVFTILTGDGEL